MRFLADERGNMALLFAMAFSLSGVIAAIAVDAASLYHERRMLQAAVDLAAISAAARPNEAEAIARTVLAESGFVTEAGLAIAVGRYVPDAAQTPAERFVIDAEPANAVRVEYDHVGTLHFAHSFTQSPMIRASGLAMAMPEVSFSVGSRLASLNGGIANALLGTLLGTNLSLSVMDYNALAAARVDALAFLDALAQEIELDAGSYDELLDARASAGDIAAALANLTGGANRATLTKIALAGAGHAIDLGKLFDLGRYGRLAPGHAEAVIGADLSVLEILSAAAALADGDREVWLGLGGSLPGIAGLSVALVIGEPAQGGGWFAIGAEGTIVRTAQLRLRVTAEFLGGTILQQGRITLPIWLDLGHAEARVAGATCPDSSHPNGTAEIAVLPGALDMAIGEVSNEQLRDFGAPLPVAPARILEALSLRVSASASAEMSPGEPILLEFSSSDIGEARLKTARTPAAIASLGQALLGDLALDIKLLGLGLSPLNVIANAVKSAIAPIAAPLDSIVESLLTTLGLGLGEADIRVYGVRCGSPVLVG